MLYLMLILFFNQKTAYEMRISDWNSDVCSSDLFLFPQLDADRRARRAGDPRRRDLAGPVAQALPDPAVLCHHPHRLLHPDRDVDQSARRRHGERRGAAALRSEEHTSELQSLMRTSYAVLCLKNKIRKNLT